MIDYNAFVAMFPEFGNPTQYSETGISLWITEGYAELDACRFGTHLDMAVMLFAAHNTVLGQQNAMAVAAGGVVGQASGPLSSKTVGPVSASYDVNAVTSEGAGIYNSTSYGQRLWKMMLTFGSGPMYVPPIRPLGGVLGVDNLGLGRRYRGGFGGFWW
jgi:hypothetical protein